MWKFHKIQKESTIVTLLESLTISAASIFGISFYDENKLGTNTTARLILFVIMICNSLFFYTYGGFLTSSLAIPIEQLPFTSPEDILKTNYR